MRVNLIYSILVFQKKKTLKKINRLKKKNRAREQCNSLNSVPITG